MNKLYSSIIFSLILYLILQVGASGFAHSFQSFNTCYKDTGLWGIYFVSEAMQIEVSKSFKFDLLKICFYLGKTWRTILMLKWIGYLLIGNCYIVLV